MQDTDYEASDNNDNKFAPFGFFNVGSNHLLYLRNMLLLNNKSTANLFCNKKLVTGVWTTYESMIVKGNGGTINTTHKYNVKGYGEVWFNEQSIIKILALKNIKLNFRVKYNSNNCRIFTFHKTNRKEIHFNTFSISH